MANQRRGGGLGCLVGCLVLLVFGGFGVAVVALVGGGVAGFLAYQVDRPVAVPIAPAPPVVIAPLPAPNPPELEVTEVVDPEVAVPETPPTPEVAVEAEPEVVAVAPAPSPRPAPSAPRPAPTVTPKPAPEPAPAPAPAPAPTTKPAPMTRPGSGTQVDVEGGGSVVLVSGSKRYPVPGAVPAGKYEMEVTFEGSEPITVGKITVGSDTVTIRCNERMQICRGS